MKKFTLLLMLVFLSVFANAQIDFTKNTKEIKKSKRLTKEQVFQQKQSSFEKAPIIKSDINVKSAKAVYWDVQFNYNLSLGGLSQAGIETDGAFLYTTKWNSDTLFRYKMDGTMQDTFFVSGVTGLRDLAFDGTYFYAGSASNLIYQLDFTPGAETLVSTITAPTGVEVRHIAYNSDSLAFWVGNWATDMFLVNMSGAILDTILASDHGLTGNYGSAYDNISVGGPYLWVLSTSPEGYLYRIRIADTDISLIHDINTDVTPAPLTIGGGLFIHPDIIPGTTTLGGLYQGDPNGAFGYDLSSCREIHIDIAIDEIYTPNNDSICSLSAAEELKIRIHNYGIDTITGSFDVAYSLNAAAAITETINLSTDLLPDSSIDYTFLNTEDLLASGNYDYTVYTLLATDENLNNDTTSFSVISGTEKITVETMTDAYNYEASWLIINTLTGDTIATNPILLANDTLLTTICTSENGCYTLILNDSYGDGGTAIIVYYNGVSVDTISATSYLTQAEINYIGVGCPTDDAAVTQILSPNNNTSCNLSASDSVTIELINYGTDTISGTLDVAYSVNGGTPVQETITLISDIAPLETLQYTFTSTVDLSAIGEYEIKAYTELIGDGNNINDTLTTNVQTSDGEIEIRLYTDTYGSETSWLIINQVQDTIAEMSGFSSSTTYTSIVCVSDTNCYTFILNDSYGDGGANAAIYYNSNYVDTIIGTSYTTTAQIGFIASGCPQEGDIVIKKYVEYPLSPISLPYQFVVGVSNEGNILNEEVKIAADVISETYTDTVLTPNPLGIGESAYMSYSNIYNTATTGIKQIKFDAQYVDDIDQSNNIDTVNILFTDTVLSRDWDDTPTGSIGIGAGSTGAFGHPFTILDSDTLSSVSFLTTAAPINEITSVDVYTFNGTPGTLLASSNEFTFTQSDSAWYTLSIPNGLALDSGTYFVAVREADASISLASSTNYYTDNTLWYNVNGGTWTDATGSFNHTLFLRLNFGVPVITKINDIDEQNIIKLYPNPAKDQLNIETNYELNKVQIIDITGKMLVQEQNNFSTINISDLHKGVYFIKLYVNNNTIVKKFIKE